MHISPHSRWLVRPFAVAGLLAVLSACDGDHHSYSLGGSVSGLVADGLVLANGSATLTVPANATLFEMPAMVADGASYSVTIKQQPSGLTCSVANGNGTIRSTKVANVVVTCSSAAGTLGGTVSGLSMNGLVLANGADTVTVDARDSSFIFSQPVAAGGSYVVTVQTQPNGQSCAVGHGSGTMTADGVSDVTVTCTDQPLSLGGTISGLAAAGLVLANGSDTLSVTSGASTFMMSGKVDFGAAYSVVVHTQPAGLTCTVSNGSGTMPAAAITNVTVVCAQNAFTIGGSVSGLTATGLVLANGTDTRIVASGAANFTMPTPIAHGSSYTIVVQSQPMGLTCTVGNGTGLMGSSAVTAVAVTCAVSTYSIGGTISGLTASGLVLANGADTRSIGSTATVFSMNDPVAHGGTYDISIARSPTGQFCTLRHKNGTATAAVTSVTIACYDAPVGSAVNWTVPAGVTQVTAIATGGGGAGGGQTLGGSGGYGGKGGVVTVALTVAEGDSFAIKRGGGGVITSTTGGGSGGGSTYVALGSYEMVAGGGGGGGNGSGGHPGGSGGNGVAGLPAPWGIYISAAGADGEMSDAVYGFDGNGRGGNWPAAVGDGGSEGAALAGSVGSGDLGTRGTDWLFGTGGAGGNGGGGMLEAGGLGFNAGGFGGSLSGGGGGGGGYGGGGGGTAGNNNVTFATGGGGGGGGGSFARFGPGITFSIAASAGDGDGGAPTVNGNDGSVVLILE